ncbi:RNA 2',3'-cyclic phosphodiesterase [Pontibacter sp. HSC-14F20]|uniref:RNA 2',3'-cyclic phosphodiesterase n=1 Tax=Pontibacter sp. HSC-14F20 TaxID=2864136 RepID=UPI001C72A704|nr:RNA 2',3'-cyclic phosphodiesterase [Pontibacter sp. HSC-14F20]MBX0335231.1 RNA 2',3'-cyclic phosphodiesterase [Pontibacter sp. HSC-14F20]
MGQTTRLFIAAPLPDELKAYFVEQAGRYKSDALRQVPTENLHLTLYFIGNVPASQLPAIQDVTAHLTRQFTPFTLQLEAIEPGPKPRSPRLIWARFRSHDAFAQLSGSLTQALSTEPPLHREPKPHVTLARFRKDRPVPHSLQSFYPDTPLALQVNEIAVWHSELGSPHPHYSILQRYPLTGNHAEGKTV